MQNARRILESQQRQKKEPLADENLKKIVVNLSPSKSVQYNMELSFEFKNWYVPKSEQASQYEVLQFKKGGLDLSDFSCIVCDL